MVRYINDGQHQTTPHTLRKLEIIKRERSRRQRGPPPRMLHQEQYHTGSEERGADTSWAYALTMHLRAPARHIRYAIFEEGHYLLAWIEGAAPSQDGMPEDGLVERVSTSPTRRRRLSLSRTSSLHTSNTRWGKFHVRPRGPHRRRHPPSTSATRPQCSQKRHLQEGNATETPAAAQQSWGCRPGDLGAGEVRGSIHTDASKEGKRHI